MKNFDGLRTPCYVVDEAKLIKNLELLQYVQQETGCRILLAQKCFSMFRLYPLLGKYLAGTTASGIYEARLGHEEMGRENHVFAPAFKDEDMRELAQICDHVIFNSLAQFERHKDVCAAHGVSMGLRVNPECSTQGGEHAIYDPCAYGSRLGVTLANFPEELPEGVDGLHFHTLCEQNSDDLVTTFKAFEKSFGKFLPRLKWLNLGGGHHITRADYDLQALLELLKYIKATYEVEVYLEPGEAVALNAGYLVTEVLDIVHNGLDILILDASAACHMPDVLEMPYRPPLLGGFAAGEKPYTYRLSSMTCLAGDVIGDYSFEKPVQIGDRLIFADMAIYTMVKNNTFNGLPLPDIALLRADGSIEVVRRFGYEDFKGRLS
ncbi:MAG: carboxynorspermidine decarboxylase [Phascolarctobacterium sp.]|uniref:carboxynorspermidine decarboxylase n=1 Tax=Phascolarctobacterium sp. TaxID=2049039 RepID=UPI0026DD4731|nr:carboxynorspermidine decarboxylase [Phascolarctobacterium sp.]MDO4920341.1 carboxynorspermidine decarboxylase [Phascolarctobacterium sp.]